ncbi:MAG: cation transporter, partial [Bacteroidales bacterium]|nr:cation transporter [Bacteroidales bacterium]
MDENSSNHHHLHHHLHHHSQSIGPELKKIYLCAIVLNGLFVLFEMWMGYKADSVSLVSDAAHKLIDVLSLGLVLLTFYLS